MKKLIIIFLLFATSCFAQIEGEGLDHGKLGLNKISGGNPGTTAIDSIAYVLGSGSTITDRVKNTYPALYGFKKLWSGVSDSCVILRRSLDNAELSFGFVNDLLDTASVRSWLDTNIITNGTFDDATSWVLDNSWAISGGTANYDAVGNIKYLRQDGITITLGQAYRLIFEISVDTAVMQIQGLLSTSTFPPASYDTIVTSSLDIALLRLYAYNSGAGSGGFSIDNVSIKQITPSVPSWHDQSGNYNDAIQTTAGNQPVYNDSLAIRFDGVNDYLTNTMGTFTQPNTFIMTGAFKNVVDTRIFSSNDVNNREEVYPAGATWRIYGGIEQTYITGDNMTYISAIFNGASSFVLFGAVKVSGNVGANSIKDLNIGCSYAETYFTGSSYESFIMSQYGLT